MIPVIEFDESFIYGREDWRVVDIRGQITARGNTFELPLEPGSSLQVSVYVFQKWCWFTVAEGMWTRGEDAIVVERKP